VCGTAEGFVEVHGERVTLDNAGEMAQRVAAAQALGRKALYRINRDVSLSRAIGDFDLREFGVVATPDVTVYAFDGAQATLLLVLASDGVWDVMDADHVTSLLEQSPEAAAAARNAHAAAEMPWAAGALDPSTPDAFFPALASTKNGDGAEASKRIAAANEAANQVAHFLVKAAKGVAKNNDDVTVLVAALAVGTPRSPDTSPVPNAASLLAPQLETEVQAEGLPALPGAKGGAVPEEIAASMATSPAAAHAFATEE
jgi:serine/threonine protein phosphatase PrpC